MSDAGFANPELSWAPPLPTIGRGGQRAPVPRGVPFDQKVKSYYLQVDSCSDFFVRALPAGFRRKNRLYGAGFPEKLFLRDLDWTLQYKFIMSRLYGTYSSHFQRKVSTLLKGGKLRDIRQWFYTANGVVLPYLMEGFDDHTVIDSLTRYVLEGCASNYSHFISSLKRMKKLMRKKAALVGLDRPITLAFDGALRQHATYLKLFNSVIFPSVRQKRERFRSLLLWTQSRGTGLCDSSMIERSLIKFRATVTERCLPLDIDVGILQSTIRAGNVTGLDAQVSFGPKACLQFPQKPQKLPRKYYLEGGRRDEIGGQTRCVLYLAQNRVLHGSYDLRTLEFSPFLKPRPVRNSQDLLSWAIHEVLTGGWKTRSVRYHCVEDQSKARSITVAHYAYQVVMGAFSHALVPAVISAETKTGLTKDRNLWRFLHEQLAPENPAWDGFKTNPVRGFSTDLEEATDFGNWWFAKAVWSEFIRQTSGPRQPTGLMLLAKSIYTSRRLVFFRVGQNRYDRFWTSKGFLMGDYFTKVVLTIGQDYNVRKALLDSPIGRFADNGEIERTGSVRPYNLETLKDVGALNRVPTRRYIAGSAYTLVGDDVVVIYAVCWAEGKLSRYFRSAASTGGWKISEDDTFDSDHLLFYCEEGSLVPSGPVDTTRHMIWRGRVIDYLDYPRIRLLLPVKVETDTYSQTNVGRFDLLGKEAKWTTGTASDRAQRLFSVAQVLQHIIVARDIECLCPYTPKEIGGDGSYDPDPEFFSEVIRTKSKSSAETLYRMERQLMRMWSHKYVTSDKPRGGVFKHDLILPTIDKLRQFLPERAVVVPPSREHAELLAALPRGVLESPSVTFFKIVKRVYYRWIFLGKLLPNLMVRTDVETKRGSTEESSLWRFFDHDRLVSYLTMWRKPGFSYRDMDPYFVVPYRHKDILSLNWVWKPLPERPTETSRLDTTSFLDVVMRGKDLPLVVDRLNMFFETDPLLLIRVRENNSIRGVVGLVSKDKRLGKRIVEFIRSNRDRMSMVRLIEPAIFFLGRIEEVRVDHLLLDAGAINFFGRTAGRTNLWQVNCNPLRYQTEVKFPGVQSVLLDGLKTKPLQRFSHIRPGNQDGFMDEVILSSTASRALSSLPPPYEE